MTELQGASAVKRMLPAALAYAAMGWPVFPCNPRTKAPLIKGDPDPDKPGEVLPNTGGVKKASLDPDTIRAWWTKWPKAMIAVAVGKPIGAFVVDLDACIEEDTGEVFTIEALLDNLAKEIGAPLPDTVVAATPRGGRHLYFDPRTLDWPTNRVGKDALLKHIDIRSTGGYVIVPPSVRSDGRAYEWLNSPRATMFAVAPDSLVDCGLRRGRWARENVSSHERAPAKPPSAARASSISASANVDDAVRRYALAALDAEITALSSAGKGTRNDAINRASFALGQLVAAEALYEGEVRQALEGVVKQWPSLRKSLRTIDSGLSGGMASPRDLSEIKEKAAARAERDWWRDIPPPKSDDYGASEVTSAEASQTKPAEASSAALAADGGSDDRTPPEDRPTIKLIGGELPRVVDEAEAALIASGPDIYRYGGQLVRPIVDEVPAADMTRTKVHRLVPITRPYLVDILTAAIGWVKFDRRRNLWIGVDCPDQIADTYLAREGRWLLPPLVGIINAPMIRADGSILDKPGYDARTGLLYRPDGIEFDAVPVRPTRKDADRALLLLDDLISTFPFVGAADRSVALSAILSALDRRAVSTVPMHTFSAPVAGSGKSMLVDLCSLIATGYRAPVIDQSKDDIETDKRLVAALLRGGAIVSIDNVDRALDSALLCQALTSSGVMQLRVLGSSRDVDVPSTAMFYATGNNLTLAGDLTRRAVVCRLDPGCERPELREFQCDPPEMVRQDRQAYVAAALTVLRAYFVAEDRITVPPLGSYEAWSRRVREALVWLGRADPCDTMASARRADPVTAMLSNVINAWRNAVGINKDIPVQGLIAMTGRVDLGGSYAHPDLREALLVVAGEGKEINVWRLGKWLSKNQDRVIDQHKITRADVQTSTARWRVEQV